MVDKQTPHSFAEVFAHEQSLFAGFPPPADAPSKPAAEALSEL